MQDERRLPKGAYEGLIILAAAAFALMTAGIVSYGVYGSQLTRGLDAACAEAAFLAGQQLERVGNVEGALQRYRQAMEGQFRSTEERYMCGRAIGDLLSKEQRYAEAVEAYRRLPAEAYEQPGALAGYVTSLWHNRQYERAATLGEEWLEKARAAQDSEQILWANNVLMHIANETGEAEEALEYAERVIALDPASDARLVAARLLAAQGETAAAIEHVEGYMAQTSNTQLYQQAQELLAELKGE